MSTSSRREIPNTAEKKQTESPVGERCLLGVRKCMHTAEREIIITNTFAKKRGLGRKARKGEKPSLFLRVKIFVIALFLLSL